MKYLIVSKQEPTAIESQNADMVLIMQDSGAVTVKKDRHNEVREFLKIKDDASMAPLYKSYLQSWVTALGLRHQGVLLTSIRGCDTRGKYAPEKPLIREMRGLVGMAFDARELEFPAGFMTRFNKEWSSPAFKAMCQEMDGLPVHYVMHILHAIEIIGYHHPQLDVRTEYSNRYFHLCDKFHLKPETAKEMEDRLGEDRIAKGTVEL